MVEYENVYEIGQMILIISFGQDGQNNYKTIQTKEISGYRDFTCFRVFQLLSFMWF